MSIIQTVKKVNGKYFKGNITDKGYEMTHFMTHQPAVSVQRHPQHGWSSDMKPLPLGQFDSLFSKVTQNFAVLSIEQVDEMITELDTIRREMAK